MNMLEPPDDALPRESVPGTLRERASESACSVLVQWSGDDDRGARRLHLTIADDDGVGLGRIDVAPSTDAGAA